MDALDLKGRTSWEFFQVCLFAFSIGLYSWHNIWEECFCKSWSQDRSGWHAVHRRSDVSLPRKEHDKIEGLTWLGGFWWNNQTIGYCRRGKDGEQTVQARFLDSAFFSIQWPMTISGVSLQYMSKRIDHCSISCGYWQGQVCGRFEILYGLEGGKKLQQKTH